MEIKTYEQMSLITVRHTFEPGKMVRAACNLTMRKECGLFIDDIDEQTLKFLLTAEHTSVLEHASLTIKIAGVSRSFLAQVTRQRMATITSASQHYADYSDMPFILCDSMLQTKFKGDTIPQVTKTCLTESLTSYKHLVAMDIPKEEARQVLPNAAEVQLLWTINARSLCLFLRQRMCERNVNEMKIFADKLHAVCMLWWPELFQYVGAPCHAGTCNQGHMRSERCK